MTTQTLKNAMLRCMLPLMLIGSCLLLWSHMLKSSFPNIEVVRIAGSYHHLNKVELQNSIMPFASKGFFDVEISKLQHRLQEMPWVSRAVVTRRWPHTLEIHLEEHQAVAVWGSKGLLNTKGEVFNPPKNTFPAHLPQLKGVEGQELVVLKSYQEMSKRLAPLGLQINNLELSNRHAYSLALNNGPKLILGRGDVKGRLERFVKVYPNFIKDKLGMVEYIDMRYHNGMAIRWRQAEA